MNVVVFLGPTLPVVEARALLDAHYLPPAAMGDVYAVIERERPEAIGIIDGYFDSVPSVWHKEILFALARGVRVVGASSMGALRAAELSAYGMEGCGWVFESFRSGELEDDDEVAVVHGDADTGYRPLSAAMVNLRVGLQRACERGFIAAATRDELVALGKSYFYPERSWESLLRDAAERGLPEDELGRLQSFVRAERPDIKREDACELLTRLAGAPAGAPQVQGVELPPTVFWDRLTRSERPVGTAQSGAVRGEGLRRFVKATDPNLGVLLRESLLMHLVRRECEMLGVEITQEQFDAAVRDFRAHRNLLTADSVRAWLERAGLDARQFSAMMMLEAQITALLSAYAGEVDNLLLDALASSGRLAETLARHADGEEKVRRNASARREPTAAELEAFYRSRVRQFAGSPHAHARGLGFTSWSELMDEVRKIYEDAD
jgi:hypothetical protein